MAFASTIQGTESCGSMTMTYGKWDSDSTTTGEIITGLERVEMMMLTGGGAAETGVSADAPTIEEVFPLVDNTDVTINTTSNVDGYWIAWGY